MKPLTWGFRKIGGTFFGGPYNDYSILGYILGVPYLGKVPHITALVLINHFVGVSRAASTAFGYELEPAPLFLVIEMIPELCFKDAFCAFFVIQNLFIMLADTIFRNSPVECLCFGTLQAYSKLASRTISSRRLLSLY